MNSHEIRRIFRDFFVEKHGHLAIASSSLIPHDDPTVLLTTAGMQQFAPYFLGLQAPPSRRLTSIQKCFRAVGKLDDVLEVGDPTHLTFFEMLGNFSVGDYFKDAAIDMAWELITEGYEISPDRIWITVEPDDDYSRSYWRDTIGIDASRIQDDPGNIWGPVGDTGPFGPNSEIYVDLEWDQHDGGPGLGPMSEDEDRYLEIWNLVFVEFNQLPNGESEQLAMQNVDTGSGLERVAVVLQGVNSIYETDLFLPIVTRAAELAAVEYGESEQIDESLRIIADHCRGVTFLIADGVLPGNEGRGYVLRRILRRAVQKARTAGIDRAFMSDLSDVVIDNFGEEYPELRRRRDAIHRTLAHEEEAFGRTLQNGMGRLETLIEQTAEDSTISGADAFRLHDTYGFPIDLTVELAGQAGRSVDINGFREALEEQRTRSRANLGSFSDTSRQQAAIYRDMEPGSSVFVGYEVGKISSKVWAIAETGNLVSTADSGRSVELILDRTPFYAESGGQVGDTGEISTETGSVRIYDTRRPTADVIVHIGEVTEGFIEVGQIATAEIDAARRAAIRRNHTATHLLHRALREVLGAETQQAGSLVAPDRLRFDFTSHRALGLDDLETVASIANREVIADKPIVIDHTSYDEAVEQGAMALFGEKYGDVVRTVEIPEFSLELCGGTHVARTGEIGPILILSESSIGSGVRRIEAISGTTALEHVADIHRLTVSLARDLRTPVNELDRGVSELQSVIRDQSREIDALRLQNATSNIDSFLSQAYLVDGVSVLAVRNDSPDRATLMALGDRLRDRLESGVIVLAGEVDTQVALVAMVTPDLVGQGYHAGKLIQSIAPIVDGRGGGRPETAQGGGSDVERIDDALAAVDGIVKTQAG